MEQSFLQALMSLSPQGVSSTPLYDFDLTGPSLPEGALLERNSGSAFFFDSDGALQEETENDTPAFNHVYSGGVWQERGVLNRGAVQGMLRHSGKNDHVTVDFAGSGLTADLSEVTIDGLPVLRLHIHGTASSGGTRRVFLEEIEQIVDVQRGDVVTMVAHIARQAGTMTGVSSLGMQMREYWTHPIDGPQIELANSDPIVPPAGAPQQSSPVKLSYRVIRSASGTFQYLYPALFFVPVNGAAIDITLDFHIQVLKGSFPGDVPFITEGVAPLARALEELRVEIPEGTYDVLVDGATTSVWRNSVSVTSRYTIAPLDGGDSIKRVRFFTPKALGVPNRRELAPDALPAATTHLICTEDNVTVDGFGGISEINLGSGKRVYQTDPTKRPTLVNADGALYMNFQVGEYFLCEGFATSNTMSIAVVFRAPDVEVPPTENGPRGSIPCCILGQENAVNRFQLSHGGPLTEFGDYAFAPWASYNRGVDNANTLAIGPAIENFDEFVVAIYARRYGYDAWNLNGVEGLSGYTEFVKLNSGDAQVIGRRFPDGSPGTPHYLVGDLLEVRIYNGTTLTEAQRRRLASELVYSWPPFTAAPPLGDMWSGATTDEGFGIFADVNCTSARLIVSENQDLSSPAYVSAPITPTLTAKSDTENFKSVLAYVTGLDPDKLYYYNVETDGEINDSKTQSVRTRPVAGVASEGKVIFGSCNNFIINQPSPSHVAIATQVSADPLIRDFLQMGDISYAGSVTDGEPGLRSMRQHFARSYLKQPAVRQVTRVVSHTHLFQDHDAGANEHNRGVFGESVDQIAKAEGITANAKQEYIETHPHYPFRNARGIAQTWDDGLMRFIGVDTISQAYFGRPHVLLPEEDRCIVGSTQPHVAYNQVQDIFDQLVQAAVDGVQRVFLVMPTAWYHSVVQSGFHHYAPIEKTLIEDYIRDFCEVPVTILTGDMHNCYADDGTHSDSSTGGGLQIQVLMSSPLRAGAYPTGEASFNGRSAIHLANNNAFGVLAWGLDGHWECKFYGAPYDGTLPTLLGTYGSDERLPEVNIQTAAPADPIVPGTIDIVLEKDWQGVCSVNWATSYGGHSGTATFLPNKSTVTITVPTPAAGASGTLTIASPSGCTIGGDDEISLTRILAETKAYLDAMAVQPDNARALLLDDFIGDLKTAGLWTQLDTLYLLASHDDQAGRLNLKNPGTFTLAKTSAPVFVADRGFTGDGVDDLLTATGYNPSTAGLNFSQDSAVVGLYIRTLSSVGTGFIIGTGAARLNPNAATPTAYAFRLNDGGASTTYTFGTGTGHFTIRRNSSANRQLFRNGSQVATGAIASTGNSTSLTLFGGTGTFNNPQLSLAYTGAGLSDADIAALDTRVQALKTAIGW
jgi:hypothetical protein